MLFELKTPLYRDEVDMRFTGTHLGQAHIAGTGPEGKTCRECAFFGKRGKGGSIECPGYYAADGLLKQGKCHNPIPGKSSRAFPHYARACVMFADSGHPWPASDPDAK